MAPAAAEDTPTCFGEIATIVGDDGDNIIEGTPERDVIVALAGNDEIRGRGGDDLICGGDGDDTIRGNAGNDLIEAGEGDDWVGGGKGADTIRGGGGKDTLRGGVGNDQIHGARNADFIAGGGGSDFIHGGTGADILRGGKGDDEIRGHNGPDELYGMAGNDVLFGGNKGDYLDGGADVDRLVGQNGTGDACLDDGASTAFETCELINAPNATPPSAIGDAEPDETPEPPVVDPAQGPATSLGEADQVIGNGTPASCTSEAVVDAVAAGGVIVFDCGPEPVTIAMEDTARVFNNTGPEIVIDGGGLVTLDGQDERRILYMNTCDPAQVWTTPHCDNQDHPRLTVQNMTFVNGFAPGSHDENGGGGAIFALGGRFSVINSVFDSNRCAATGPDVGGGALRVFQQYQNLPVEVIGSTFLNGECSNGGAISSIGVSWSITDSVFRNNRTTGYGANPAQAGTPGGGNGGAIALDGNTYTLELRNTEITGNHANEGGGAVFFVSNDRSGTMSITDSTLQDNVSQEFETRGLPGIFYLGNGDPVISNTILE